MVYDSFAAFSISMSEQYAATLPLIEEALARIRPHGAKETPVLTSGNIDKVAGRSLFFKGEIFQLGGSFKFRGACNSVFSLTAEEAARGVVCHSSGNHAAAVALAASIRGIASHIVVPIGTPQVKIDAVKAAGGSLILCEPTIEAREATCAKAGARFPSTRACSHAL